MSAPSGCNKLSTHRHRRSLRGVDPYRVVKIITGPACHIDDVLACSYRFHDTVCSFDDERGVVTLLIEGHSEDTVLSAVAMLGFRLDTAVESPPDAGHRPDPQQLNEAPRGQP